MPVYVPKFKVEGVIRGVAGVRAVTPAGGKLLLDGGRKRLSRIVVRPGDGKSVKAAGKRYRGTLEITGGPKGALVVNVLPVESYLYGVLPVEIGGKSPAEALKAQAVVARSFTLAMLGKHGKDGHDLCRGTCCQVYGGRDVETPGAREAVEATRGRVLARGGVPFTPYYHASCGGSTASPEEAWAGGKADPALRPVKCPACRKRTVRWTFEVAGRDFAGKLTAAGYKLKQVRKIEVLQTSGSGRIGALMIVGRGESVIVSGHDLRRILGAGTVKSTRFSVEVRGGGGGAVDAIGGIIGRTIGRVIGRAAKAKAATTVLFRGRGFGHGVGLCQDGAVGMAKEGMAYRRILSTYFGLALQNGRELPGPATASFTTACRGR
jgi:stage II sporulation protein D